MSSFEEKGFVQADNMQRLFDSYPFLSTFLRVLQAFWNQKNPDGAQKFTTLLYYQALLNWQWWEQGKKKFWAL